MLAESGELTVNVCDDVAVWLEESVIVNTTVNEPADWKV